MYGRDGAVYFALGKRDGNGSRLPDIYGNKALSMGIGDRLGFEMKK